VEEQPEPHWNFLLTFSISFSGPELLLLSPELLVSISNHGLSKRWISLSLRIKEPF